jgi:hypothetical protein
MPVHCHRTEQSFHSRCFAIFPVLYTNPAISWNIKNNMDYGWNGLVKIHCITVSQISQEGHCKTLHHGRTNKILFRSHWMMRAAAHFDFMRFCTHIRYTHTHARCVCGESGHCNAAERYPIGIGSNPSEHFYSKQGLSPRPRIYRTESGKTADGRRFQIRLIQTVIGEQTDCVYTLTHTLGLAVHSLLILRRGAHVLCSAAA